MFKTREDVINLRGEKRARERESLSAFSELKGENLWGGQLCHSQLTSLTSQSVSKTSALNNSLVPLRRNPFLVLLFQDNNKSVHVSVLYLKFLFSPSFPTRWYQFFILSTTSFFINKESCSHGTTTKLTQS